ncbi:hypothetical protein PR048_006029 [Dryococelus australis]|uniref:Uncharacterized protein n=1 Tax=Dryococelus australis TaxID=614101 RepID=A0ABQ9I9W6_9NEOP|nr:hypothetical protein PR048_006029 [Dryococelus australis]
MMRKFGDIECRLEFQQILYTPYDYMGVMTHLQN